MRKKKHPCTIRFVDDKEGTKRCVKFNHSALGNYSNIPLKMMYERCENIISKDQKIKTLLPNGLFNRNNIDLFEVPKELFDFGEELKQIAVSAADGEKKWVTMGNDFFSEKYKMLRLKYLHFTASCQLVDWKLRLSLVEFDATNFGNECNYTNEGQICRIMYDGNRGEIKSPEDGVQYFFAKGRYEHKPVNVDFNPSFYTKNDK